VTTIAKGLFVASVLLGALFATSFDGAAQGRAVKQELISEDEFPVSFEAHSREGTKKTFVNIPLDSGNTWWIGVWDTDQVGYRRAMIQVWLAP
jgi:ABC-type sugar transport system substrate-binding protein